MTAGCYYDNASFADEDERKPRQMQSHPQPQPQPHRLQVQLPLSDGESDGGRKPTLLALSRSASVRYHRGGIGALEGGMGDLLARQIDQQRVSEPPLSRNPSIRYSRRFPPTSAGGGGRGGLRGGGLSGGSDSDAKAAVAAASAAADAIAKAAKVASTVTTSVQVHSTNGGAETDCLRAQGQSAGSAKG